MSNQSGCGLEPKRTDSSLSETRSTASPEFRRWVAAEHQVLKEQIPGPMMSDSAANYLLDRLVELAAEIGVDRFHGVIVKAIETCERRPVLATFRRLAGLNSRLDAHAEALAQAWALVTLVVTKHIGRDTENNAYLKPFLRREGGTFREEPVPVIPEGIRRAVASLGGWEALADAHAGGFWNHRFQSFRDLYGGESTTAIAKIPS